jgi:hypothetical protein
MIGKRELHVVAYKKGIISKCILIFLWEILEAVKNEYTCKLNILRQTLKSVKNGTEIKPGQISLHKPFSR